MCVTAILLNETFVQQPRLSVKQSLNLERIIAMFSHHFEGQIFRPKFKHLGIHAEPEVARQGDKERLLPVEATLLQVTLNALRLFLKSLNGERRKPTALVD